jgi:hypothetical protein
MKRIFLGAIVAAALSAGCDSGSVTREAKPTGSNADTTGKVDGGHDHPSEGPHHGTLIELGNEEYHAELIHDEALVTVYILDKTAKQSIPIEAADITINLVHDGKPTQFKLAAIPDANDPAGKSSRFSLQDSGLVKELEHDHAAAKLSVLIEGKAYRGEIHHEHEGQHHH